MRAMNMTIKVAALALVLAAVVEAQGKRSKVPVPIQAPLPPCSYEELLAAANDYIEPQPTDYIDPEICYGKVCKEQEETKEKVLNTRRLVRLDIARRACN